MGPLPNSVNKPTPDIPHFVRASGGILTVGEGEIRYIDGNRIELLSIDEAPSNDVVLRVTNNQLKIYERSNSNTCPKVYGFSGRRNAGRMGQQPRISFR